MSDWTRTTNPAAAGSISAWADPSTIYASTGFYSRPVTTASGIVPVAFYEAPSRAKCDYCRTWNQGEKCTGCGAPVDWSHASR